MQDLLMPRQNHDLAHAKGWSRRLRIPTALAVAFVGSSATVAMTFAGCHGGHHAPSDSNAPDTSSLIERDAMIDVLVDATPDAKPDAKPDAPPDAPPDARPDARPDAPPDARPDTPIV